MVAKVASLAERRAREGFAKASRVKITVKISPQVSQALDALLWAGLHGDSREAVVERLICDRIMTLLRKGTLRREDIWE